MTLVPIQCEAFTIPDPSTATGPILVMLVDSAPFQGVIHIECHGRAWATSFSGMGGQRLRDFIPGLPTDYLVNRLACPMSTRSEWLFLHRVVVAVLRALNDAHKADARTPAAQGGGT